MDKECALLVFAKPPLPGLVKTRLSQERGGPLTRQEAAEFFSCSLLDVLDAADDALDELQAGPDAAGRSYRLVICTAPGEGLAAMHAAAEGAGERRRPITYLEDEGEGFEERFAGAFKRLFARGADSVVAIGADAPAMPRAHLVGAFRQLARLREDFGRPGFVMAPCQESGIALVGCDADTPISHEGVYYREDGRAALDVYRERVEAAGIPCACLPPVSDVDDAEDLRRLVSHARALRAAAPFQDEARPPRHVLDWADRRGL